MNNMKKMTEKQRKSITWLMDTIDEYRVFSADTTKEADSERVDLIFDVNNMIAAIKAAPEHVCSVLEGHVWEWKEKLLDHDVCPNCGEELEYSEYYERYTCHHCGGCYDR